MRTAAGLVMLSIAILAAGCKQNSQTAGPSAAQIAASQPGLPEWAPSHPSREFLRAAKVLAPVPREQMLAGFQEARSQAVVDLTTKIMHTVWPKSYEFFGTLTDAQMKAFLTSREIRIPVPSLNRGQKRVLDEFVKAADAVRPGQFAAALREEGAEEDLANVAVGFRVRKGMVGLCFWVNSDSSDKHSVISNDFAMLPPQKCERDRTMVR